MTPKANFIQTRQTPRQFLRSAFKFNNQPGTFPFKRTRCKTCPFISNKVLKISGPNRSVQVTDHFTCISTNVIYCKTCTLCKKIYIGETGRRLADRFREHLGDVEMNQTDASKPVARHFNLRNHSHHNMTICGLYLHHGNTESRKSLEQKLNSFFNWVHSLHTELMNASHSTNSFTNWCDHICTNGKAPLHSHINHNTPQFLYSLWRRANACNVSFLNLYQLVWENQIFVLQKNGKCFSVMKNCIQNVMTGISQ